MDFKFWNDLDKKMKRLFMEMGVLVGTLLVLIVLICLVWNGREEKPADTTPATNAPVETTVQTEPKDTSPEGILADYMAEHGLTDADYTADMMEVYKYFPEVRDFILAIPLEAGRDSVDDISKEDRTNGVPLFLQWDERWGYKMYGDSVMGMSGCGPTCLSMVAYYLTGDTSYSPVYMADFAVKNGYRTESGSTWSLFNEGPFLLGLESKEVPLHEGSIAKYVNNGTPVVASMGPGDFTLHGHFIVITGYEDGEFIVNDPFSVVNSEARWSYAKIESQIKNLWAIWLAEVETEEGSIMVFDYHFGVNKPYPEVEAGFVPALQDFYDHPDKYAIAPFQIFGNLWYVGDQKVTSHLIDTGDGLILFDTGYGHTTHMMLDSIRGAGFDPMDIKIIIHSHGHFDHFGSGNELRQLTGAKVYMSSVDTRLLREKEERALMTWGPCPEDPICWPDVLIEDGDHVKLGNTDITCILSAGHTAGTMTYFFDVTDGEKTLRAGYFGGTGMLGMYQDFCKKFDLPLDLCAQMKDTIQKLRGYSVDIMLGNHPAQNRTLEKRAYMLETGENPFLDSDAWLQFLTALEERRQDFEDKGY